MIETSGPRHARSLSMICIWWTHRLRSVWCSDCWRSQDLRIKSSRWSKNRPQARPHRCVCVVASIFTLRLRLSRLSFSFYSWTLIAHHNGILFDRHHDSSDGEVKEHRARCLRVRNTLLVMSIVNVCSDSCAKPRNDVSLFWIAKVITFGKNSETQVLVLVQTGNKVIMSPSSGFASLEMKCIVDALMEL